MIHLVVPGRPRGKERPRFNAKTGRTYTPAMTQSAEERIRGEWHRAGSPWLDGPLEMRLVVVVARPGGHFKVDGSLSAAGARAEWPTRRPDLSNVLKLAEDALNGCAFKDDSQIVFATVARRWCAPGEREHTVITVDRAPVHTKRHPTLGVRVTAWRQRHDRASGSQRGVCVVGEGACGQDGRRLEDGRVSETSETRPMDWLAAARQYIRELPEPPMGGTVDALLQMLADENERLREAGKVVMDDAYRSKCHYEEMCAKVAEVEADAARLAEALRMARGFLGFGIRGNPMSTAWVADEALRQHEASSSVGDAE